MGVYSSTAAHAYADKIKAVYEYLDEIRKVADRLTPVEDLTSFQAQIESLYERLDLLVEASNLIVTMTPTGESILTGSVESIKALLNIGEFPEYLVTQEELDAALAALTASIGGDLGALVDGIATINISVAQLDQYRQVQQSPLSGLQTSYENIAAGLETNQLSTELLLQRLTVQEQFATLVDARLESIDQELLSAVTGLAAANGVLAGHTAEIQSAFDSISLHTASIDSLASTLIDLESDVTANTSALNLMETTISSIGDDITAQSAQTLALKSVIGGSGNLLPNADFAVGANGWQIVVAEDDWASSVLETNAFNMPEEVNSLTVLGTPTPLGEIVIQSPPVLIAGEGHYIVSGYPCVDNGTVALSYKTFNAAGDVLDQGVCPVTFNVTTNPNFDNYTRTWVKFLTSTDAVKLRLYLTATGDGDWLVQAGLFRPMVEKAWIDQVGPSEWTPNVSGVPEALAEAVQTLETETALINGELSALSAATTDLVSRVGTTEAALINEMITRANQHGATVATLNSLSASMEDVETGLAAQGTALSTLSTTVSSLNGTVSSHSSSLTSLQAQVDAMDTDSGGFGSAISALDVRVTATEDEITSMSTAITALESSVTAANKVYAQATPPSTAGGRAGDLWIDTDDGKLYTLTGPGGSWVLRPNNKNKVFMQAAQPTAENIGDLWIETDNSNKPWVWNGTTWVDATDTRITSNATALTALTTRVTAAEGVNTSQASALTAVTSRVTTAEGTILGQASAATALTTRVTTVEGKATIMEAKWTVSLDVNGYISGVTSVNDGTSASFDVRADKFSITKPGGGVGLTWNSGTLWNRGTTTSLLLGQDIGSTNDLLLWVGPNPASEGAIVKDDGVFYVDKYGNARFKGELRASTFDMRSTVISTGGGREAPFVIYDCANAGSSTGQTTLYLNFVTLQSPDYGTGFHGARLAGRVMDVFLFINASGYNPTSATTNIHLEAQYDGGAWERFATNVFDVGANASESLSMRYTTKNTAWNTVKFRAIAGGLCHATSGYIQVFNFSPSQYVAGSTSNPDTGEPGGGGGTGGGGAGGGTGGGGGWCVTESMYLGWLTRADEVEVGEIYRTYSPKDGVQWRSVLAVGAPVKQPCVRITSACGAVLEVSRETPFDLIDDSSALAHQMLDQMVLTENDTGLTAWVRVVSVEDIGMQWVVPISFGGLSFAAGRDPDRRIFSHNMAKTLP